MLPPTYAEGKPQLHELAMLVSRCPGTSLKQKEPHHLLIPNTKWCKAARREKKPRIFALTAPCCFGHQLSQGQIFITDTSNQ